MKMNFAEPEDPEQGPFGLYVRSCLGTIDFEKGQIEWAKDRLQDDELTPKQRELYEEILTDARQVLNRAEGELEELRFNHFQWLQKRESA